jgi:hypothetical protein
MILCMHQQTYLVAAKRELHNPICGLIVILGIQISLAKYGQLVSTIGKTVQEGTVEKIFLDPLKDSPKIRDPEIELPKFPCPLPSKEKVRKEYYRIFKKYVEV